MKYKAFLIVMLGLITSSAFGGTDIVGKVVAVHIDSSSLKFELKGASVATYCAGGWAGLNMIVPKTDPQFPYYYSQVLAAYKENWNVYIGNVSALGTGIQYCDITKTGYGILVIK